MKLLFVGESWFVYEIHYKGYDSLHYTRYHEGATALIGGLRNAGVEVDYIPSHEVTRHFPKSDEQLQQYDAIILSDVGSNTFLLQYETVFLMEYLPNSLELIRDFVARGGGLLMIGGYMSYMGSDGKANYKNTVLADVLPVEMLDGDDRMETPEGVRPTNTKPHSITEGFGEWPRFLGYNRFKSKTDAEVLVTAKNDPFLVVGSYGEGKTACFASDCAPHWGPKEFTDWEHYPALWMRILKHIAR
ncbi:glutamine amidotransferase [Paenibacillus chitinolyticus]